MGKAHDSRQVATWLLTLAALALSVFFHEDFGITWDESVHARYAQLVFDYFLSGGEQDACNSYLNMYYYGPLFDLLPALVSGGGTAGIYEIRHLWMAILAVSVIPALGSLVRLQRALPLVIFASLALMTMPYFVGHSINNLKDVPFAITTTWFIAQLAQLFLKADFRWRQIVICGVSLGLALAARPGGFPLLCCYLAAAGVLWLLWRRWYDKRSEPRPAWTLRRAARLGAKTLTILLIGWTLMVAFWPWSHADPLSRPLEAISLALAFNHRFEMLFAGELVSSTELPWEYLPKYLLITTPPTLLILAAIGLARALHDAARRINAELVYIAALAAAWLLLPLVGFVVLRPNVYSGIRHFLFILPPLAIIAGVGACTLWQWIARRSRALGWAVVALVLLIPCREIIALHPYQSSYFNSFVGGIGGANGRYDLDSWVSSYREGMLWINAQARRDPSRTFRVLVAGDGSYFRPCAAYYAAKNVKVVLNQDIGAGKARLDYYLATTGHRLHQRLPQAPVVFKVEREGGLLAVVKRVDGWVVFKKK